MRRIVVFLKDGLGDHIMAIPLLKMCRNNLQDGDKLYIYVGSQNSSISKRIVEQAIAVGKNVEIRCIERDWYHSKLSILKYGFQLRRLRPTLFLFPHSSYRLRTTLFAFIIDSQITVLPYSKINSSFFRTVPSMVAEHKVRYYFNFGLAGSLENKGELDMSFNIPEYYKANVKNILPNWEPEQKWIGFSPGSGVAEAHKRWPISSYITLGKMILDEGAEFRLVIFGSPNESSLINEIMDGLKEYHDKIVNVMDADIMIPSAVLKYCHCLVSACSGLIHLAAAMNTPVVALYGPTNPGFTGPYIKKIRIIRLGLKCSPCYRIGFIRGCSNPLCMTMISPSIVYEEILKLIFKEEFNMLQWFKTTNAKKPQLS